MRSRSRSAPPGEDRHGDLQEIGEQRDAEYRDDRREDERTEPRLVLVTKRGDEDAGESAGEHAEIAAEDDESHRAHENAEPSPPLRMFRQDALVVAAFRWR